MPVTQTLLTSGSSGTDATSYATASISPTAGRVVLVAVTNIYTGAAIPTLSGAGATWTQIATNISSNFTRCTLFRGIAVSTGALTIDLGGATQLRCVWDVIQLGNVDTGGTNGANAIVQSATSNSGGSATTSNTVTLAAFGNANNATFGAISLNDNVDITPGSGFSEISDDGVESSRLQTQFKTTNDTTVDWSWGSSLQNVGIAVELKFKELGGAFLLNLI